MKLKNLFFVFSLFFAKTVFGQDCDQIVYDLNGDLHGQEAKVEQAAQAIINQGAEVRIRVLAVSNNLDLVEKGYENSCESWRSGNGGRKNTLITILVATQTHRTGIYYGDSWKSALDAHFNRIKTVYMNTRFKDGDLVGGLIIGEQQIAARLVASKDEALHPNAVVNQAVDLSGLWKVMDWILFLVLCVAGIWLIYWLVSHRKKTNERQQRAILYRSKAANLLKKLRDVVETAKATKTPIPGWQTEEKVNSASELFSELSNSERTNPDTPNLSAGEYDNIAEQYRSLCENLEQSLPILTTEKAEQLQMGTEQAGERRGRHRHRHESVEENQVQKPVVNNTTIFVNEEVERPSYHESAPDPEPTPSYDSPSSDSGGGDSSWGGDSGGGGGDSSFGGDSGGSDSGGGGGDSSW